MKKSVKTPTNGIQVLWQEGFFKTWQTIASISKNFEKRGNNFSSAEIGVTLLRGKKFLTRRGKRGNYQYIQKKDAVSGEVEKIENALFSDDLLKKLGKDFKSEFEDLKLNFGRSGNCTAFLLRKFLEKLIYIAFAHHNLATKLEDKSQTGRLLGLEAMIGVASLEKIKGIPFILPKTAQQIRGIKFLGDTSAHNPLAKVDMETIIPQMPFIIVAYRELAQKI